MLILLVSGGLNAESYLSTSEVALIGAGSASSVLIGHLINDVDSIPNQLIGGPLPFERSLQRFLGGHYTAGKTNFLDGNFGSAITPVVGGIIMLGADLKYPGGEKSKTVLQDQFLYCSGLAATKGVTSIFKGVFNRERPMCVLEPEEAAKREKIDFRYDRQSFFSGHTSGAFFSMSFLNSRIRTIMRDRMSPGDYDNWNWVSPAVLFSWAGFVGWSRIHSYDHYVSDVLVGALVGYLMSELFLSLGDDLYDNLPENNSSNIIKITIRF